MQVPYNTVKFRGMYKETMKFLLRCTKKEPSPAGEGIVAADALSPAPLQNKNTVRC